MRVLTVPNWSFSRNKRLLAQVEEELLVRGVDLHDVSTDLDHNRTVTAFSGDEEDVLATLWALCDLILPAIDLRRHMGVHPRIGALDVCPFIPLQPVEAEAMHGLVYEAAEHYATTYHVPVFLYEKSERGRHEAELPALRKGGYAGLLERELSPDFGPKRANPQHGATVMGWRDWLIALNVNLKDPTGHVARSLAREIRTMRAAGDPRFLGVRALGLVLASREQSQVSINVTLPDVTPVDAIVKWVMDESINRNVAVAGRELIGVIRAKDSASASLLPMKSRQVVEA